MNRKKPNKSNNNRLPHFSHPVGHTIQLSVEEIATISGLTNKLSVSHARLGEYEESYNKIKTELLNEIAKARTELSNTTNVIATSKGACADPEEKWHLNTQTGVFTRTK